MINNKKLSIKDISKQITSAKLHLHEADAILQMLLMELDGGDLDNELLIIVRDLSLLLNKTIHLEMDFDKQSDPEYQTYLRLKEKFNA